MAEKKVKVQKAKGKPAAKATTKKAAVKLVAKQGKTEKVAGSLTVALFDKTGKEKGTIVLPKAVFGGKVNKALMAQAVRVYLANQRMGAAQTKTRGQVDGSTRKIYQQKGTGRARHGGIRAPIFVGGGTAHGPKRHDFSLTMPAKMKRAAVISALSAMAKEGSVKVISGFAAIEPKTKVAAAVFAAMGLYGKKTLFVMPDIDNMVFRSVRNIDRMQVRVAKQLTTYDVLNAGTLVVMQEALETLESKIGKSFVSQDKSVRNTQDKKDGK